MRDSMAASTAGGWGRAPTKHISPRMGTPWALASPQSRRPKRRGAPPQAADSRCAKLNAIFGSAVLPLTLKSGTTRLSRNS